MKLITKYQCDYCSKIFDREISCKKHEAKHKKISDFCSKNLSDISDEYIKSIFSLKNILLEKNKITCKKELYANSTAKGYFESCAFVTANQFVSNCMSLPEEISFVINGHIYAKYDNFIKNEVYSRFIMSSSDLKLFYYFSDDLNINDRHGILKCNLPDGFIKPKLISELTKMKLKYNTIDMVTLDRKGDMLTLTVNYKNNNSSEYTKIILDDSYVDIKTIL